MMEATERAFIELTNGAYTRLHTKPDGTAEILLAIDAGGSAKQVGDMPKGIRFQLYFALHATTYGQPVSQGIGLPFFCADIFETFDRRPHPRCLPPHGSHRTKRKGHLLHPPLPNRRNYTRGLCSSVNCPPAFVESGWFA